MLNVERISIFSSVFVFLQENQKMRTQHRGESAIRIIFAKNHKWYVSVFPIPDHFSRIVCPLTGSQPYSAKFPHHTALSHGLEEQQNRILLVHTARPAAKNPFTIDTILRQEKLQNLQKNFLFFCFCRNAQNSNSILMQFSQKYP